MSNSVCFVLLKLVVLSMFVVATPGGCSSSGSGEPGAGGMTTAAGGSSSTSGGTTGTVGGTGGAGGATTPACASGPSVGLCSKISNCLTCNKALQTSLEMPTSICCPSLGLFYKLSACACSDVCAQTCTDSCTGASPSPPSQACATCMATADPSGCADELACCTAG